MINQYIVETGHPVSGRVKRVEFPVWFSRAPATIRCLAPEFGQHTEKVLIKVGGYSWEEIAQFKERGVLG